MNARVLLRAYWKPLLIAAAITALSIALIITTQRLKVERANFATFRAQVEVKISDALAKALIAKQETEARYAKVAEQSERAHVGQLDDARSAADRYIAANRVRSCTGGAASGPVAAAEDRSASVPEKTPALPVMVSEADVRACSAVTAYALSAHNWANELEPQ